VNIDPLLQRAQHDGVALAENYPFLHSAPAGGEAGVLLVHGLTATPRQLRDLGHVCARSGLTALGVRLPGHGTTPADLSRRHWEEWLAAVEEGWELLARRYSRIYGIGVSTGALLLLLAARRRQAAGLVLHSPFLRLRHPWAWTAAWLAPFYPYQHRLLPAADRPYYYPKRPLRAVAELLRLLRIVRRGLPQQVPPTLVLAGCGDETVQTESVVELFLRLESERKECHLFGREAGHVLTAADNPRQSETINLTLSFLQALEMERLQSNAQRAL